MPGIKLDAMETPYPWPPELAEAWQKQLLDLSVNRYPDPRGEEVKQALRNAMGVPPALDILLGNGSDEIIQMLAMAVAAPGRVLLAPGPGFAMFLIISRLTGLGYVGIPLTEEFELAVNSFVTAMCE